MWPLRRCVSSSSRCGHRRLQHSYAAEKARCAAHWRHSDSAFGAESKRARNVVFVDRRPLVSEVADGAGVAICWLGQRELRECASSVGLEPRSAQTALLDVAPWQADNNDVEEEFVPIVAAALGLKRDTDRELAAAVNGELRAVLTSSTGGRFVDFRYALLAARGGDAELLAKAQTLLQWANTFKHCPKCTQPLDVKASKSSAHCSKCDKHFYPPVHPVMMCFITSPCGTKCLLVQHHAHRRRARRLFTCVAGFVDAGETLHRAAVREVAEELGIDCAWHVSDGGWMDMTQFWPFPNSSLMIPCHIVADPLQSIELDPKELVDARWYTRAEIRLAVERTRSAGVDLGRFAIAGGDSDELFVAPPGTLAFKLITCRHFKERLRCAE